jgi:monovalent cation/hydrogen antiporter
MSTVPTIAWTVAFVLLVVGVTGVARKAGWSAPLVLVAVGAGAAFVPGVPNVHLEPDVVLVGVLPALLFASALGTSFLEVRSRGDSILALSVGLVIFTAVVVGLAAWALVPGLGLAAGIAFGAILAPTDAVSVNAIAGGGGLPRRLASLLESEGLLNDATALVTLNTAIAAILAPVGPAEVGLDFLRAVVGGLASGALVAVILNRLRRQLKAPVLDTSLSLIAPYLSFLPAYAVGGSGFLAVAVTGLWLGYRAPLLQSAEARIAERVNWRTVSFLLENAVFLLIGLQLPAIVRAASASSIGLGQGIVIGVAIYLVLVLARFVWVFGATLLYRSGPERLRERRWDWRTAFAISFSGIRGVVTLAAVFLLPEPTPARGYLQLLAFVVVVVSLLQGLGLRPLVTVLGLPLPSKDQDRMQVRALTAEAQEAALERLEQEATEDDPEGLVSSLRQSAQYRMSVGAADEQGQVNSPDAYARLRLAMLQAERRTVLQARSEGRYEESTVNAVLADFDSIEAAVKRSRRRDLPPPQPPRVRLPALPRGTRRTRTPSR